MSGPSSATSCIMPLFNWPRQQFLQTTLYFEETKRSSFSLSKYPFTTRKILESALHSFAHVERMILGAEFVLVHRDLASAELYCGSGDAAQRWKRSDSGGYFQLNEASPWSAGWLWARDRRECRDRCLRCLRRAPRSRRRGFAMPACNTSWRIMSLCSGKASDGLMPVLPRCDSSLLRINPPRRYSA